MAHIRYLLELPGNDDDLRSALDLVEASRRAAADLRSAGVEVRVLRSLYVPEDDLWYLLVEAPTAEAAAAIGHAAGWNPRSQLAALRIEPHAGTSASTSRAGRAGRGA